MLEVPPAILECLTLSEWTLVEMALPSVDCIVSMRFSIAKDR